MMKKKYTLVFIVFISYFASAQQISMYSHYFYKPMIDNPAFTGNGDATNAMLVNRSQWTGFKDAPQLTLFSLDGNLLDKKVGIGMSLMSERKGINNKTEGDIYYSYRININDETHLSFGLTFGVINQTIDFTKAIVENNSDPTLSADFQHKIAFNTNAGIAFVWKGLELGIAVPQLLGEKVKPTGNTDSSAYYTQARHYVASAKYKIFIQKEKGISIVPQALVRFVANTPFQYDGTLNFDWQDKFWIGATYKSNYAVAANVGFCLHKQLFVGYSYDFIIGNIGKYSGMSNEIMVNFKFGKNKKEVITPIVEKDTATAELKNSDYEEQLDKLQNQLKKSDDKLNDLNNKLEQLEVKRQAAAAQQATQNTGSNLQQSSKPGVADSDGIFVTSRNDFKDDKNAVAEKGFYVIVGIFFYRDYAMEEIKNFNKKGFKNSNWIYSESIKNNYVFVEKVGTKEEALEKVKAANATGANNAWVLNLTD
jgi:type IX secretion system PorP/SprF family membrane protein